MIQENNKHSVTLMVGQRVTPFLCWSLCLDRNGGGGGAGGGRGRGRGEDGVIFLQSTE